MSEAQGRVGRWLRNKWHLDSLIAIGGMAAVYSSTHRNGARAAIKMLHSQYTRNEQARRRFLAEGYAANKVGHRNAVLVLDDDTTEDGEVYLVMELLEGESLEGRLERVGVMGPMEVLELTDQLLEVLACAHPQGILHRDIKPANIYITRDGAVKLLDFGLARVRELSAEAMDQSDGIVFGTVSYIAPEQARADNQNLDARSDLWSIAATMFRALSGETVHPLTGPIIDRLLAVARKHPRSIATVCPTLPRPVIELVDRALAFDPETRWPSANVMRVVVQDVLAQLREEAEARGEQAPEPAPPTFARRSNTLPPVPPKARPPEDRQERPRTDPMALSMRPQSLPSHAVPGQPPADARGDAQRAEEAPRRSRTLLTKEGRAELRRILDAKKANLLGETRDEATPTFSASAPSPAAPSSPAESGIGEVDVEFDDSLIEVTIEHTRHGRPGPIAEPLADPVTPAPIQLPRVTPEPRGSTGRSTGSHPTLGARTPEPPTTGRAPEPPTTGSHPTVAAATVPAGTTRSTGSHPTVATVASGTTRSTGSQPVVPATTRSTGSHTAVSAGAGAPVPEDSPRAPVAASLEDTMRRRTTTAVPEDRRARTTSASYPSLSGPQGMVTDPSGTAGPRAMQGEIVSGPAPISGEIGVRSAPGIVSGEIVSGEIVSDPPARPATRAADITRVGPAPVAGEINSAPKRAPHEITRVAPAPAGPAQSTRAAGLTAKLDETIRPKTIPPVSSTYRPSRPTPMGDPSAPVASSGAFSRPQSKPEPVAESGGKKAPFARAGVFAAPPTREPAGSPSEPPRPASPVTSEAAKPAASPAATLSETLRPSTQPPRAPASASERPSTIPPRAPALSDPQRPATLAPRSGLTSDVPRPAATQRITSPQKAAIPASELPRPAGAYPTVAARSPASARKSGANVAARTTAVATNAALFPANRPAGTAAPGAEGKENKSSAATAPYPTVEPTAAGAAKPSEPAPPTGAAKPSEPVPPAGTRPVGKDSPVAPTAAPTSAPPTVEAEAQTRPSTEPRAKTGAVPVLPFNFLRPGAAPATKPGAPASDPPKDGEPPTGKKS